MTKCFDSRDQVQRSTVKGGFYSLAHVKILLFASHQSAVIALKVPLDQMWENDGWPKFAQDFNGFSIKVWSVRIIPRWMILPLREIRELTICFINNEHISLYEKPCTGEPSRSLNLKTKFYHLGFSYPMSALPHERKSLD